MFLITLASRFKYFNHFDCILDLIRLEVVSVSQFHQIGSFKHIVKKNSKLKDQIGHDVSDFYTFKTMVLLLVVLTTSAIGKTSTQN